MKMTSVEIKRIIDETTQQFEGALQQRIDGQVLVIMNGMGYPEVEAVMAGYYPDKQACFTDQGHREEVKVLDLELDADRKKLLQGCQGFEEICYLMPSLSFMKRILEFEDDGFKESLASKFLLQNKTVRFLVDFRVASIKNTPLQKRIGKLVEDLRSYGIVLAHLEDGGRKVGAEGQFEDLITEKSVETAARQGLAVISGSAKAIITPLAKDRARELGIELRKE